MDFLLDNVWEKVFIEGETFVEQETAALSEAGTQLLGSEALWEKFLAAEVDFTQTE